MNPTLSIIVPIYNVEAYLRQCIDSILNQSYTDFELILVDDGSPDNCGEICDAYALQDNRIIVIHKKNGGLSSARNAGIEIARGKYLSFVDSDDFVSFDFYKSNIDFLLLNSHIDMAILQYCRYYNEQESMVFLNQKRELTSKIDIVDFMMSMKYVGSAWVNIYKKEVFYNLRYPVGKIYEDGYILPDIVERVNNVYVSDIGVYFYRVRKESIMGAVKSIKNWCDILDTHVKQLDYCYAIDDNKKLFLGKFKVCSLALIYANLYYHNSHFKEYTEKFQAYNYSLFQLLNAETSLMDVIKLYSLKKMGFMNIARLYKLFRKHE